MKKFQSWQVTALLLIIYDVLTVGMAHFMALWLRFDLRYSLIPNVYLHNLWNLMPVIAALSVVLLWHSRLYQSIWRFASFTELIRVLGVAFIVELTQVVLIFTGVYRRMPISYYLIGLVLTIAFWIAVRFMYRFVLLMREIHGKNHDGVNVMLIGAGQAGQMLLHDSQRNKWQDVRVLCIIDDDKNKHGRFIDGVPVIGGRDDIMAAVAKYGIDEIYIAVPTASAKEKRDILNICKDTGCVLRNLPSFRQLVNGEVSINSLRDVAIEDLLGREQIKVDMQEIFNNISGKVILVTGGGGSIGSELCRQIATHSPKQLIIFDIYENNAFEIEQELRRKLPNLNLVVLIGSVRDEGRLEAIFAQYKPEIVYHAAAHKHVPLMEYSPCEAIKNNVLGTYQTAMAAVHYGTKRFVLISTDKAVNPTNVMGASKRICELIIQTLAKNPQTPTEFVAVRFGNVLGSNGSVVPFFKKQIAEGGPVTVTHPDIVRYFMTIPEAVSLVLQAGCYAQGGEIFVLDMGEPVKIDTLARNLIKLMGLKPDEDIKIVYTGLRPGEKLYEEKLMAAEGLQKTANDLIYVGEPLQINTDEFLQKLDEIVKIAYMEDNDVIKEKVKEIVPEYHAG
ncbi:MAG: nucleoside-diphosphate sugar epimerase/dehydratase [Phascolarctobacterium sp.]|nr:nucleoside-diphosphate sugar epimerase/dehydratase [Phascolarctobacterium sp.]